MAGDLADVLRAFNLCDVFAAWSANPILVLSFKFMSMLKILNKIKKLSISEKKEFISDLSKKINQFPDFFGHKKTNLTVSKHINFRYKELISKYGDHVTNTHFCNSYYWYFN